MLKVLLTDLNPFDYDYFVSADDAGYGIGKIRRKKSVYLSLAIVKYAFVVGFLS